MAGEESAPANTTAAAAAPSRACRCLNVRIHHADASGHEEHPQRGTRVKCASDGIQVIHPSLVARETIHIPSHGSFPGVRCLNCASAVYYVTKPAAPGPSRVVGFSESRPSSSSSAVTATSSSGSSQNPQPDSFSTPDAKRGAGGISTETSGRGHHEPIVRSADGIIWILPDCLGSSDVPLAERSPRYSPLFRILVETQAQATLLGAGVESTSAFASAAAAAAAERTAVSPMRQSGQQRRLSYSTVPTVGNRYALPPIPTSLLNSPPTSPMRRNDSFSSGPFFAGGGAGANHSPSPSRSPGHALTAKLEAFALERLRQHRLAADAEIQELVRVKRAELENLEIRARGELEVLMDKSKAMPGTTGRRTGSFGAESALNGGEGGAGAPGLLEAPPAETGASTTPTATTSGQHWIRQRDAAEEAVVMDEDGGEGEVAYTFERRRAPASLARSIQAPGSLAAAAAAGTPTISGGPAPAPTPTTTAGPSSSLSALSASFAMRGRDLPPETNWSAKRRLRERYPDADHSALPSAATSAATSEKSESDAEPEEERGRGRGRERAGRSPPTAAEQGIIPSTPGRAAASTHVDRQGGPAKADIASTSVTKIGGQTLSRSASAAEAALRAEVGSPSTEQLKPATRTQRSGTLSGEKKVVAFAEVPAERIGGVAKEAAAAVAEPPLDEGAATVFDIDEDLEREDEDDAQSGTSPKTPGELAAAADLDPATSDADSSGITIGGLDISPAAPFEANASMSMRTAGSFSALAASQQAAGGGSIRSRIHDARAAAEDPEFDPASLRRDGRTVKPQPTPTGRARSKERAVPTNAPSRVFANLSPETLEHFGMQGGRGTIGFRVAVGEAEAKLSGLLAPHAPSHRRLWTGGGKKRRSVKYQLDEAGDDKWAAWQQRVHDQEAKQKEESEASPLARSLPTGSQPIPGMRTSWGGRALNTTTFKDETSGFDLEPKTSLPYQEKLMVPGLRQATRRFFASTQQLPKLPTIPDASEAASPDKSRAGGMAAASLAAGGIAMGGAVQAGIVPGSSARRPSVSPSPARGALPGSVVTRGFAAAGEKQIEERVAGAVAEKPVVAGAVASKPVAAPAALASSTSSLAATPVLGSSTGSGRRSPRPPYVPPPPPTSFGIVLEPDPAQCPAPVKLFDAPLDASFAENDDGEEEEEDWEKVLAFMHRLERLKINRRTGWLHHRVKDPESIADHMYRMAVLAMLCPSKGVDLGRCVMLALVHDMAEAEVGDLTPLDGVGSEEKKRREQEAMAYLVHDLLGSSPAALRLEALWNEYEERQTPESRLVKDLDRFELCLQAVEYERSDDIVDLQPFFRGSIGLISHPRQRRWAVELMRERAEMWRKRGRGYVQEV